FAGISRRRARPDASVNRCGQSPLLLADSVRCDPKPLPSRKPVLTRCADSTSRQPAARTQVDQWPVTTETSRSNSWFGDYAHSDSQMLAPSAGGDLAIRDEALAQPEHQPGMALLLSLILCGTGQI